MSERAAPPSEPRQTVRLLNGGRVEQLPAAMVDRFPTWVLADDGWLRVLGRRGVMKQSRSFFSKRVDAAVAEAVRLSSKARFHRDAAEKEAFAAAEETVDAHNRETTIRKRRSTHTTEEVQRAQPRNNPPGRSPP